MFNLFKKTKICSVCGIENTTNKVVGFDPSNRGEFPELGKEENLCLNHLKEKWTAALEKFDGFAICYLPIKGWNSYSYSTLEQATSWGVEKNDIEFLNNCIDKYSSTKNCNKCSKSPRFILFNFSYDPKNDQAPETLCAEHFVEKIAQEIESQDMTIDEINVAFGDRGLYMHGEF